MTFNPNCPDLLADYGICLGFSGDWEGGLAHVQRALDLSPHPPGWYRAFVALHHYMRGDYAAALAETEAVRLGAFFWGDLIRAMIHGQLGNEAEAAEQARSALAGYAIGANHLRFLTCHDFRVSGSDMPDNCREAESAGAVS